MSFFKRGAEGAKAAAQYEAAQKARIEQMKSKPRELWLKNGQKTRVMFLDDPDFYLKRHTVKVNGKWDTVTCLDDEGTCPGCISGSIASMCVACTVLTMEGYKAQSGKEYKYQKQLLIVKGDAMTHLFSMLRKRGTLKYAVVELSRGTQAKSPAIGAYDYEGKFSPEKFENFKKALPAFIKINTEKDIPVSQYLQPFDYEKVLAPLPMEQMAKLFGVSTESYGASDEFSCADAMGDDFNEYEAEEFNASDTDTFDTSGSDYDESPFGDNSDNAPSDDSDSKFSGMSDSELVSEMVQLGCRKTAAEKMSREDKLAWITEASEEA